MTFSENLGQKANNSKISTTTAAWITTEEGKRVQRKVWSELTAKLESIEPGVTRCLD